MTAWSSSLFTDPTEGQLRLKAEGDAWLAWFHEADDEFVAAVEHQSVVWFADGCKPSEAFLEATERALRAYWRWHAALTALNAYADHRARQRRAA
jgi:hypothetical protein